MSQNDIEQCAVTYPHLRHKHRGATGWVTCRGIRIPAASRAQPAKVRAAILAELQTIKNVLGSLTYRWGVSSQVYEATAMGSRPRRLEEYPENDERHWAELAAQSAKLIRQLHDIQTFALDRQRQVHEFNRKKAGSDG